MAEPKKDDRRSAAAGIVGAGIGIGALGAGYLLGKQQTTPPPAPAPPPSPTPSPTPAETTTVEAPMANLEAITVQIQNSNQPQQLPAHPNRQATLHALAANAATIYIGSNSVNADAFPLNPGSAQDTHIDDLSKVWIYGTKGDKLSIEVEWGVGVLA